jgi:hypothetical protein
MNNSTKRNVLLLLTCLSAIALAPKQLLAESGIRIKSGPTQLTAGNPPCNAERDTWFKIVIENINYTCNEAVILSMGRASDGEPGDFDPNFSPQGGFKFLGFSSSEGGALSDEWEIDDMEDESTATIFFAVKTMPAQVLNALCDFEFAEFAIRVCDDDGGCDWGTSSDLPCPIGEKPTPFKPTVRIDADQTPCPPPDTGTGTITGTVTRSGGLPAANARVTVRRVLAGQAGCKGAPDAFFDQTFTKSTPWADRGEYEMGGLPFPPGDYEVTARDSGQCAQTTVNIAPGGSAVVDLVLAQNCP